MTGADRKISQAPEGDALAATQFAVNEAGTSKRASVDQLEDWVLRPGNVDTLELEDESIGAPELANAINAVAKAFDAFTVDGYRAADIAGTEAPIMGIISWDGPIVGIPAGWQICDGTGGTPDLRDYFVVTAGGSYAVGASGGADSVNWTHLHAFGTLGLGACSSHKHAETAALTITTTGAAANWWPSGTITSYNGSHTHAVSGNTANFAAAAEENRPLYLAQAFIQRIA